jgi:hypothetical protein
MRSLISTIAAFAPAVLAGCGLPLVCPKDPHSWYDQDNATYTLLNARFDSQKGSWDFDPIGKANSRRKGSYNLNTGDLAWVDSFDEDYWLIERKVDGYGTIYDNGNLDLLVKVTWKDILEDTWAQLLRIERTRCDASITRYEFDPDWTVDHAPAADGQIGYWSEELRSDTKVTQYGEVVGGGTTTVHDVTCTQGVQRKDSWDYDGGVATGTRTDKYDGTGTEDWAQYAANSGADYDFIGTRDYYFDGSWLDEYGLYTPGTAVLRGEWSILYQYDGAGSGTYTGYSGGNPDLNCDVTITAAGRCTASCDDGQDYDCS